MDGFFCTSRGKYRDCPSLYQYDAFFDDNYPLNGLIDKYRALKYAFDKFWYDAKPNAVLEITYPDV